MCVHLCVVCVACVYRCVILVGHTLLQACYITGEGTLGEKLMCVYDMYVCVYLRVLLLVHTCTLVKCGQCVFGGWGKLRDISLALVQGI